MWWVYLNGEVLHKPSTMDRRLQHGVFSEQLDVAGQLVFNIPITHPMYRRVLAARMEKGAVSVERDGVEVWRGRILTTVANSLGGTAKVTVEGEMAELNDSELEPYDYSGSPAGLLAELLGQHNGRHRPILPGRVTVRDPNGYIVRSNQSRSNSLQEIRAKTSGSSLGGYLRLRRDGDVRYLDWLADPDVPGSQEIRIGKNLLTSTSTFSGADLKTAMFAQGAQVDGREIDLTGLPDGPLAAGVSLRGGYVVNDALEARYGTIEGTLRMDQVTLVDNLRSKAAESVAAMSDPDTVEVTAVDLTYAGYEVDAFRVGQSVRLKSWDVDAVMLLVGISHDLDDPSANKYTFGRAVRSASGKSGLLVNDAAEQAKNAGYLSKEAAAASRDAERLARESCTVGITATRGYALRSDTGSTILKATVFRAGGEAISDADHLRAAFGASASLRWEELSGGAWSQVGESRLGDGGFSLPVSSAQVKGKASYRVSVTRG